MTVFRKDARGQAIPPIQSHSHSRQATLRVSHQGPAPPADILMGLTVLEDIGIYKGILGSAGKKANGDRLSNTMILF
ncbi:MAG: hypothetical protein V1844_16790 [Pseudomonadota bacterium]